MDTGTLKAADGLTLHTMDAPVSGAKANVYIVHGIGEHIGRYTHVAQYLNGRGYSVFGHDHRGHGRSEGERVVFSSFDVPVRDLKARIDDVRANYPGLPLFIYGHSMGSLITTLYLQQNQAAVDGWMSSGSPLWIDQAVPAPVRLLLRGLSRVVPKLGVIPVNAELISRDPAVVAAYNADPYVNHEKVKLAMVTAFNRALEQARGGLGHITIPTLILYGTADTLTPPKGSEILYEGIASADKERIPYDGLLHELHNEPEQDIVLARVGEWLDAHIAT
jgi:acylglycerol lipase